MLKMGSLGYAPAWFNDPPAGPYTCRDPICEDRNPVTIKIPTYVERKTNKIKAKHCEKDLAEDTGRERDVRFRTFSEKI